LRRGGALPPAEAAALVAFVARGIEEAHVRGLVHRDLKPANVFLCRDASGEVTPKILDFGISKGMNPKGAELIRTTTGAVLGSPAYMSPEQAKGEDDVDGRSDVWSLGVILYEAFTGALPFSGANYNALMMAILSTPHPPISAAAPDVPQELAAVVDRALIKDRWRRIGTARELAERLEAALAILPSTSRRPYPVGGIASGGPARAAITRDTRSDGRQPAPRSLSGVLRLAVVLASALSGAGATALLELRSPPAPVAIRSSILVTTSLARATREVAEMKVQIATEQSAQAERKAQRAADHTRVPKGAPKGAPKGVPKSKPASDPSSPRDPHSGIETPGF
jgi:serine/threonine-protein kinase